MINRILLLVVVSASVSAAQLPPKDILAKNKDAIVQVFVKGVFSGTGFIVSKDGLIVTANHVVTTRESGYRDLFPEITIKIARDQRDHYARAMFSVTRESRIHDVAILKIEAADLPTVILGDWGEVQETDPITVIASLLGYGSHLIVTGIVSGKGEGLLPEVSPGVRTILFQAPIRNGFSGSPLFSSSGHVIGIVTTKVFGISDQLEAIGEKASRDRGSTHAGGVDVPGTVADLIYALHFQLISGLGSAVDIAYVKEMQAEAEKPKEK